MNKKLGFIGSGNMGSAMIGGILSSKTLTADDMYVSDLFEPSLEKVSKQFGVNTSTDNKYVAKQCNIIILSVKPKLYKTVIADIKDAIADDAIVVTIAPGQTIDMVTKMFGKEMKIVRTMPNTPAMVLEGMTAMCHNSLVSKEEFEFIKSIFESFGKVYEVQESLMNTVTGVSGSGPAYVYMFIEAMADSAVALGMTRDQAYTFAAQTVLGAAKMVIETGMHPAVLKDMVCSPGGTTIAAVNALEENGMRNAVIKAVAAAANKSATA
ncbi:MAG: pyrroline-5-carboxylate reductase [Oscillospiraceae bacterium]